MLSAKVSKLDNYPILKSEDLYVTLNGGQQFTKLDMNQAYQQLMLSEESKQFTTINTHKGLFQYHIGSLLEFLVPQEFIRG